VPQELIVDHVDVPTALAGEQDAGFCQQPGGQLLHDAGEDERAFPWDKYSAATARQGDLNTGSTFETLAGNCSSGEGNGVETGLLPRLDGCVELRAGQGGIEQGGKCRGQRPPGTWGGR
jgi:hypothetical protein